jgi:FADH2 O2-dependent halogenase
VTLEVDVAIVGSGFAGSILAMVARRLGYRVALIERGRHPRFAIGESSSPLAGLLLEQLAARYDLPRLAPLASFGAWQRVYPHVTCGLKRGFTYYAHEAGHVFRRDPGRATQLLVAASPNDEVADTHWLRSDVDAFLAAEAQALGSEYYDETSLEGLTWGADGHAAITGTRAGRTVQVRARLCVDATGPRGFLSRALSIDDAGFEGYPHTQALFSHFTGVARCGDMPAFASASGEGPAPYPVDDAALHHVFDGGWMWVLRFGNGVTSAGVAVTDALAREVRLADGAAAWDRLLARFPSIAAQFADAHPIRPFTWMPALSYRAEQVAGPGWAMLPSAAAFVDPLFSTGFPLTLLGIERLARTWERDALSGGSGGARDSRGNGVYADATSAEAHHTARFIAGCYAAFPRFGDFASYSMFYFAAASYAEMARRLDAPARPSRFLCGDREAFANATQALSPARAGALRGPALAQAVGWAVADLNIAGLCDPSKRNWYGADAADTIREAARLGVSPDAVRACLAGLGLV